MSPIYQNLPGVFLDLKDGNLAIFPVDTTPKVLILGTATQGEARDIYRVTRSRTAAGEFGITGSLIRGMYEAFQGKASNVYLMRIGAKAAVLSGVGDATGTNGLTIETYDKSLAAGNGVKIFWDDSEKHLQAWNLSGTKVYDSATGLDLGKILISGSTLNVTGSDIGTASVPVLLSAVTAVGTEYTPGEDGTNPSQMKLYEAMDEAFQLLETVNVNYVVPMDAFLDTLNIADDSSVVADVVTEAVGTGNGTKTAFDLDHTDVIPASLEVRVDSVVTTAYTLSKGTGTGGVDQIIFTTAPADTKAVGADYSYMVKDALLYLRTYEEDGETVYEWHTEKTRTADAVTYSYHEVNFAHRLAQFCHERSTQENVVLGCIGVKAPASNTKKDIDTWVGSLPEYDFNDNITVNGNGLLGNKFMIGKVNYVPGFWYCSSGWLDEGVAKDVETTPDIGRYLSIVITWGVFYNQYNSTTGYLDSMAAMYAGMISTLPSNEAPTNQTISGIGLVHAIKKAKQNDLVGTKYVMAISTDNGNIVLDAPTAATAASDWQRLTTVKIATEYVNRVRTVTRPFIGKSASGLLRIGMKTAVDKVGAEMLTEGKLTQLPVTAITATPIEQVQGYCTLEVSLAVAFELRQIDIVVSLQLPNASS